MYTGVFVECTNECMVSVHRRDCVCTVSGGVFVQYKHYFTMYTGDFVLCTQESLYFVNRKCVVYTRVFVKCTEECLYSVTVIQRSVCKHDAPDELLHVVVDGSALFNSSYKTNEFIQTIFINLEIL